MPRARWDRLGDQLHHPVRAAGVVRAARGDDHHLAGPGHPRRWRQHDPPRTASGQPGDGTALGLAVQRGQLGARGRRRRRRGRRAPGRRRSTAAALASPTNTRCVPSGIKHRAALLGEFHVQHRGLIDDDHRRRPAANRHRARTLRRTTARPLLMPGLGAEQSVHAWIAGESHSSSSRLAARPVGAASAMRWLRTRASATTAATVRLLPVPGPPVRTETPCCDSAVTAAACAGSRSLTTGLTPSGRQIGSASAVSRANPSATDSSAIA